MADSTTNFTIRGIDSEDEIADITNELETLRGFQMAEVDAESGRAEIRYGEELLSEEEIKSTVRGLGYEVE